jgi:hypothetical protein
LKGLKIFFILLFILLQDLKAQTWKPYGAGFSYNGVFDFIVFNNEFYVSGSFYSTTSSIDNIAKWDGNNWNPVGSGMLGGVYSMTIFNGELHAGGHFSNIPGVPYTKAIARWDGTNWHALASGIQWGTVNAMAVYQGDLYVGGNIVTVDSMPMRDIAKWDGTSWSLPCTINAGLSEIFSMAVFNNELYIGGYFGTVNGIPVSNVAKFDGTTWSDVGGGLNSDVFVLLTDTVTNRLYAAGNFNYAAGGAVSCPSNVAYWDGSNWNSFGSAPALYPRALTIYKNELYAGFVGPAVKLNGDTLSMVTRWDGNDWQPLGNGVDCSVQALYVFNNELAVGGCFTQAGDTAANEVASWNYTPVSISEIKNTGEDIKIIPNPFFDLLNIIAKRNELVEINLFDVTARKIFKQSFTNSTSINTSQLAKGIYFYQVRNKNGVVKKGKVVKE